jgi:hypothetical protein
MIHAFESLDVPYFIGGSLASALHGTERSTLDIDLVADLKVEQIPALVSMLDSDFYIDENMIRDAIHSQGSFNIIHMNSRFKIDVFTQVQRRFEQMQFERRQLQTVENEPGRKAYITTAEDIILAMLE